jgi:hypothetical protein
MSIALFCVALATALAHIGVGGGLYEVSVIDPAWPRRPDIIQPVRGGVDRKWFWIPAHVVFELTLVASLVLAWSYLDVRFWLWVALASHALMRVWSGLDFIPRALAFERAAPGSIDADQARRWTHRSRLRLPLDLITCGAMLTALVHIASVK